MLRQICLCVSLMLVPFIAGCSEYLDDYQYSPRPAIAEIPSTQPQEPPVVSAFATVVGIRVDDPQEQIPTSVQVRLRVDNNGPKTVAFDPRSLELSSADLVKFPPPQLRSPQPVTLAPAQSAYLDVYFPLPAGQSYDNMDLNSFQLRWLVTVDGYAVRQSVNFRRVVHVYYDPYWDYPPYGYYGGGVVIVHRGWR